VSSGEVLSPRIVAANLATRRLSRLSLLASRNVFAWYHAIAPQIPTYTPTRLRKDAL
jgi:hypothetical protein